MGLSHSNEALLRHAVRERTTRNAEEKAPGQPSYAHEVKTAPPAASLPLPAHWHWRLLCSECPPPSAWRDYPSWAPVTAEGGEGYQHLRKERPFTGLRNKHGRLPHQPRTTNANTAVDSTKATEHYWYSTTLHTRDDPAT